MRIRDALPDDADQVARILVDTWRSAYRHIFPADFLAGLSYDQRAQRWRDRLAESGNCWRPGRNEGQLSLAVQEEGVTDDH